MRFISPKGRPENSPLQGKEMNTWIYILNPARPGMVDNPTPREQRVIGEHFAFLSDLTQRGTILLAGRTGNTAEKTFGIVIFRAEDEGGGKALMEADPAVEQGVMNATLHPFKLALLGTEFHEEK